VLGEVRTEVAVEGERTRVITTTGRGSLEAPERFESSARLAVRRALAALNGQTPGDLRALAADTAAVERILASRP
jgi:hypothetical protein